jgi:hypothetical protein
VRVVVAGHTADRMTQTLTHFVGIRMQRGLREDRVREERVCERRQTKNATLLVLKLFLEALYDVVLLRESVLTEEEVISQRINLQTNSENKRQKNNK